MPERVSRRASVQTERDQEGERNRAEKETEETRGEREREGGRALCGGRGAEASRDSPGKGRSVLPSPHWGFKLASV